MVAASKGPSNEEFYSRVMPDEGMLAFVDYCTGLLSINATEEQYRAMIVESSQNHAASGPYPSLRHWRMMEAQWHEMVHCLQLSVCGFAYKLASDLWRVVTDDLAVQELSSLPDIYQAISPGTLSRVQKIISRLDESTEGVSVLSILESSAFLAQKRQAYPNLTESSFRKLFLDANFRPESPYRAAYDFVDQHLPRGGPTVFDVFQSFAFPSLFAVEPAAAFTQLVRSTVIPQGTPPEQWEWIIGEAWQRLGIHSYGMASEVYRKLDAYHPVFTAVSKNLDPCEIMEA